MPEARVVVPLVIFFVMGAAILWLLWRVVVAGGRARRETASGVAAAEMVQVVRGVGFRLNVEASRIHLRRG